MIRWASFLFTRGSVGVVLENEIRKPASLDSTEICTSARITGGWNGFWLKLVFEGDPFRSWGFQV